MVGGFAALVILCSQLNAGVRLQPTMVRKYVLLAVIAYTIGITAITVVNVAFLCRGDPKFDGGCGSLDLYIPVALIVLAPVFAVSLLAALGGPAPARPVLLATLAVGLTFVAYFALEFLQHPDWHPNWNWGTIWLVAAMSGAIILVVRRTLSARKAGEVAREV